MRVLFVIRPSPYERPGGDVVAAERSAAALRAAGVHVDVVSDERPDAQGYDVAHVFGVFEPETQASQFEALRAQRVPLVVSPIWWDRSGLFAMGPRLVRALDHHEAKRVERRIARLRDREEELRVRAGRGAARRVAEQARLLSHADVVLPASEIEAYACASGLRVLDPPYLVARYGIDDRVVDGERPAQRSGVVCIGRIERLKNQAMLLFSLRELDVDVTLVGRSYDPEYLAVCRRWATPRTRFVDRLPDDELADLLRRSAVHALPSWADLPGLVSLEAAVAGAQIVVGNRGSEREYLGPDVEYADPADPASITSAVVRALERDVRRTVDALDARLQQFTWQHHAAIVQEGYRRALARR
jgi:glycosyltransferase involved in cell wall biosynthesis